MSDKEIQNVKHVNEARELTEQNKLFLSLIANGTKTLDAYRTAGYKGSDHAAYQLRSELKGELLKLLEGQGLDRSGLMLSLKELLALPLRESDISIKSKLDLLKLLAKTLPDANVNKPQITAFVVNTNVDVSKHSDPTIDTTLA